MHLLVDGRNVLYRALFAELGSITPGSTDAIANHGELFRVYLKFMSQYVTRFKPSSLHVFWDDSSANLWRKQKYPKYKSDRKHVTPAIASTIQKQYHMALSILNALGVTQYLRDGQEADDLIYAFCSVVSEPCAILSSDGDLKQIPQKMPHVSIYNPMAKASGDGPEPVPAHDVVVQKALMGDHSDAIDGYAGIGPKRAEALASSATAMAEFFASPKAVIEEFGRKVPVGDSIFKRNLELIDLSMSPSLEENRAYVKEMMDSGRPSYNHAEFVRIMHKYEMSAAMSDPSLYLPFTKI